MTIQRLREELATVRNCREKAVAKKSDPENNEKLSELVEKLDGTRNELKELYNYQTVNNGTKKGKYFDSKILHGMAQRLTISMVSS